MTFTLGVLAGVAISLLGSSLWKRLRRALRPLPQAGDGDPLAMLRETRTFLKNEGKEWQHLPHSLNLNPPPSELQWFLAGRMEELEEILNMTEETIAILEARLDPKP